MLPQLRACLVRSGPSLLRLPIRLTPFFVHKHLIQQVLRWQFQQALIDGELDFLHDRWLKVEVRDLALRWFVSQQDGVLLVSDNQQEDVSFCADVNDLILIAAGKQDPDTLFFQRRLVIEGDTELGLYVKNLMDAIELDNLPAPLRVGLLQLADFIEAGLKEGGESYSRVNSSC